MAAFAIVAACFFAVAGLLWAETNGAPALRAGFKTTASLLFIALAVERGAAESAYGLTVLAALVFCALGDVLLLGARRPIFLAGMLAFAIGHAAFLIAFMTAGAEYRPGVIAAAVFMGWFGWATSRWLWPGLTGFRAPVIAYIAVISAMVVAAVALALTRAWPTVAIGAILFAISDVFVARDRFVIESTVNRYFGLPLYYSAQLVLAWTVGVFAGV